MVIGVMATPTARTISTIVEATNSGLLVRSRNSRRATIRALGRSGSWRAMSGGAFDDFEVGAGRQGRRRSFVFGVGGPTDLLDEDGFK